MQFKSTMRYYLIPFRTAKARKKNTNQKEHKYQVLVRIWRKGQPVHVGGNVNGAATVENRLKVSQKTKNRSTIRPSNSTLEDIPKK